MGIRSFIHRLTAPSPSSSAPAGDYKLALLVNHELKMGKGKIGAQAGHASVKSVLNLGKKDPQDLMLGSQVARQKYASKWRTKPPYCHW